MRELNQYLFRETSIQLWPTYTHHGKCRSIDFIPTAQISVALGQLGAHEQFFSTRHSHISRVKMVILAHFTGPHCRTSGHL